MNRTGYFTAQFIESFPTLMEPDVLYISTTYSTSGHICPCGCGREIVMKLSPMRWRVIYDGEVSLQPSVAATGLPCNSHYFITRGKVDWCHKLDASEVAMVQAADRRVIEEHHTQLAPQKSAWWNRLLRRRDSRRS